MSGFVHYVTDMERTHTAGAGQFINMEYGKEVVFSFFETQVKWPQKHADQEQYILPSLILNVLRSDHFLLAATQM